MDPCSHLKKYVISQRDRMPENLSVIVPCFNEEEVLSELHSRLSGVLTKLNIPYEIIFVDDGSTDSTWQILSEFRAQDARLKIIQFSRNFGHQIALTCGVDQARGEIVVIMDADLQDPPELIPEMLAKWQEGYEVVYGKRKHRLGESKAKRFFAFAFYRLLRQLIQFDIPMDTGDFRLMGRRAADALRSIRESHRFIRGMVSWMGFEQTAVLYDRPNRKLGTPKYSFWKSLRLAIDAITSFSLTPLRLITFLGLLVSSCAAVYVLSVMVSCAIGSSTPDNSILIGALLLLGGTQLTAIGIVGEYAGRALEQTKMRPIYFIEQIQGEPLLEKASNK